MTDNLERIPPGFQFNLVCRQAGKFPASKLNLDDWYQLGG